MTYTHNTKDTARDRLERGRQKKSLGVWTFRLKRLKNESLFRLNRPKSIAWFRNWIIFKRLVREAKTTLCPNRFQIMPRKPIPLGERAEKGQKRRNSFSLRHRGLFSRKPRAENPQDTMILWSRILKWLINCRKISNVRFKNLPKAIHRKNRRSSHNPIPNDQRNVTRLLHSHLRKSKRKFLSLRENLSYVVPKTQPIRTHQRQASRPKLKLKRRPNSVVSQCRNSLRLFRSWTTWGGLTRPFRVGETGICEGSLVEGLK